jgi:hypothetical protein
MICSSTGYAPFLVLDTVSVSGSVVVTQNTVRAAQAAPNSHRALVGFTSAFVPDPPRVVLIVVINARIAATNCVVMLAKEATVANLTVADNDVNYTALGSGRSALVIANVTSLAARAPLAAAAAAATIVEVRGNRVRATGGESASLVLVARQSL